MGGSRRVLEGPRVSEGARTEEEGHGVSRGGSRGGARGGCVDQELVRTHQPSLLHTNPPSTLASTETRLTVPCSGIPLWLHLNFTVPCSGIPLWLHLNFSPRFLPPFAVYIGHGFLLGARHCIHAVVMGARVSVILLLYHSNELEGLNILGHVQARCQGVQVARVCLKRLGHVLCHVEEVARTANMHTLECELWVLLGRRVAHQSTALLHARFVIVNRSNIARWSMHAKGKM